jgi:hypothetical protein
MRAIAITAALGLGGCNDVLGIPEPERAASEADAGQAEARCDHGAPFTSLSLVPSLSSTAAEKTVWLSASEHTAIFNRESSDRYGDLFVATRDDRALPFGPATPLTALNSDDEEYRASMSADGVTIYFDRLVGSASADARYSIFTAVRLDEGDGGWRFAAPTPLDAVSSAMQDFEPFTTDDAMYFGSTRNGGIARLWRAPRAGTGFGAADVVPAGEVQHSSAEMPVPSADGLALYFSAQERHSRNISSDIWVSVRTGPGQPFEAASEITVLNTDFRDTPGWLSPDNCRLYFTSDRGGQFDVWLAERTPAT